MARKLKPEAEVEVPILPPFPSESWNVTVTFQDGSTEVILVFGRGKASALRTATYRMDEWPKDRIPLIESVRVHKP